MESEAGTTSVALSSSGLIPVCNGRQLELTCTTAGRFLEWYILRIPENGHNPVNFGGRIFNNQPDQMLSYTLINHVFFNFSVVSVPNTLPLTSRVAIGPANNSLNETEIVCEDSVSRASLSAIIYVINRDLVPSKFYTN